MAKKRKNLPVPLEQNSKDIKDIDLSGLTKAQLQFLAARVKYHSDAKAARAIGLSPRTCWSWKCQSPAFKSAYDNVLSIASDVSRALANQTFMEAEPKAAEQIAKVAGLPVESASEKMVGNLLRAAEDVLEYRGRGKRSEKDVTVGVQLVFHESMREQPSIDAESKVIDDED
jgi:hypothetical protein